MAKPLFLYATGTAFFTSVMGMSLAPIGGAPSVLSPAGYRKVFWNGQVTNDPFWRLLDERKWDARKIDYPASAWPMGTSIDTGVSLAVAHINSVPAGTPFMLGGYSQGAAVMSKVYRLIQSGSLMSRASDFKGAVVFGNPMRQLNFLAPGLTWSGAWDVPGSTTGGSGCFPDRLSGCEYGKWREYVNVNEIICSTGTSTNGAGWRAAVGWLTGMLDPATALEGLTTTSWLDGISAALAVGEYGHVRYPTAPPMSTVGQTFPADTKTTYELALEFIGSVYAGLSVTPILPKTDPLMDRAWTTYLPTPA